MSRLFLTGLGMGIGFCFGLVLIGAIRELFGAGQLWGHDVLGIQTAAVMILPAGGFFVIGFIMATFNWIEYKITGKIPSQEEATEMKISKIPDQSSLAAGALPC